MLLLDVLEIAPPSVTLIRLLVDSATVGKRVVLGKGGEKDGGRYSWLRFDIVEATGIRSMTRSQNFDAEVAEG